MEEEIKKDVNNPSIDTNEDYISALNEIKQNTVSKEAYEKVREDNKRLLDTIVNGQMVNEPIKEKVDVDALRNDLLNGKELSNLEFVDKSLKLRKALLDRGEQDIFAPPVGHKISPKPEDFETAERVATVLQECVDKADGDPNVFNNEFQRRIM